MRNEWVMAAQIWKRLASLDWSFYFLRVTFQPGLYSVRARVNFLAFAFDGHIFKSILGFSVRVGEFVIEDMDAMASGVEIDMTLLGKTWTIGRLKRLCAEEMLDF